MGDRHVRQAIQLIFRTNARTAPTTSLAWNAPSYSALASGWGMARRDRAILNPLLRSQGPLSSVAGLKRTSLSPHCDRRPPDQRFSNRAAHSGWSWWPCAKARTSIWLPAMMLTASWSASGLIPRSRTIAWSCRTQRCDAAHRAAAAPAADARRGPPQSPSAALSNSPYALAGTSSLRTTDRVVMVFLIQFAQRLEPRPMGSPPKP